MLAARDLSRAFSALGDPLRCEILSRLAEGEATVTEVTTWFDVSQPAISRHLKILEDSGWVERRREGKTRPCRLNPEGIRKIDDYLEQLRAVYEANYDRLDGLFSTKNKTTGNNK